MFPFDLTRLALCCPFFSPLLRRRRVLGLWISGLFPCRIGMRRKREANKDQELVRKEGVGVMEVERGLDRGCRSTNARCAWECLCAYVLVADGREKCCCSHGTHGTVCTWRTFVDILL